METIVTAVTDEFPYYLRPKKASFSAVICIALFLMGLILTTEVRVGGWMHRGDQLGLYFRESLGQGTSSERRVFTSANKVEERQPMSLGFLGSEGSDTALFLFLDQPQKESDVS